MGIFTIACLFITLFTISTASIEENDDLRVSIVVRKLSKFSDIIPNFIYFIYPTNVILTLVLCSISPVHFGMI